MNSLELKKFSEEKNLSRNDIAEMLESSIHSVNSWFAGSRNIPKSKIKILESYNVLKTYNVLSSDLKEQADKIALNFEEAKKASKLFDLTIQNSNKDYLIKKLAEYNINIKE